MKFTSAPKNEFADFIRIYYQRCKEKVPPIEVIVGKWNFEDLFPGMSDFDARFITANEMKAGDWCQMSEAVGKVHLSLCNEFPNWARILEHLPGINLTWQELEPEESYYPECHQWSAYFGKKEEFERILTHLKKRGFTEKDEFFFLKKFFLYYGPYKRNIDPPVNLGPYENKYPLHSRIMHYFCPPLQSAIGVIQRSWIRGKLETFRLAREKFPNPGFMDYLLDIINKHYEVEELYQESFLSQLEEELFNYLKEVFHQLKEEITIIKVEDRDDPTRCKEKLNQTMIDPQMQMFDSMKFSRLMKGRLEFYAKAGQHFDSIWLIKNELSRIGKNFFADPLTIYWQTLGEGEDLSPLEIARRLSGTIFTRADLSFIQRFEYLTMNDYEKGQENRVAREIAEIMDGYYIALDKLVRAAKKGI